MAEIFAQLIANCITSNDPKAYDLAESKFFGEKVGETVQYLFEEAFFLFQEKKLKVFDHRLKELSNDDLLKKLVRINKDFLVRYAVFRDLRKKGYVLKTALKFGASFRAYEKGVNPKKAHAKWLVVATSANTRINYQMFCAKSRIANSSNKSVLLAVLDEESNVSYYVVDWLRP